MAMQGALPTRDEIDPRSKWLLEDLYPSDAEWEEEFNAMERMIGEIGGFRGTLGQSGRQLVITSYSIHYTKLYDACSGDPCGP